MALTLIPKRSCVCGEWERVELKNGKSRQTHFYFVECYECGRMTAKHTTPEAAVLEWNRMSAGDPDSGGEEPWETGVE